MIRTLKSLGLAFIAVLAINAIGASAAQAAPEFTCSAYSCTATGSNTKGSEAFTLDGTSVLCDSHFLVEARAATGTDIHGPTGSVTVTPTYTNCEAFGFLSADVTMEGCDYVFHATERVSAGVYNNHVDVVCPTGKSIKIEAGTCVAEVKAQTNRTTVKTTNVGGSITAEPNTSVSTTVTTDGFGCPLAGTGTRNATYHGHVILSRVGGGTVEVSGS
jgi:hypothetical protein